MQSFMNLFCKTQQITKGTHMFEKELESINKLRGGERKAFSGKQNERTLFDLFLYFLDSSQQAIYLKDLQSATFNILNKMNRNAKILQ